MFRLFIFLFLAGLSLTAQAQTTRFVSTTGTNANPASATSWATSTTNLQGAINASAANDQVWVAAGVYKPGGNANTDRTISFAMRNNVAIYGGFSGNEMLLTDRPAINPVSGQPSSTTLTGEIGDPNSTTDNSYHVIGGPGFLANTRIDGFVITGGNANGGGNNNNGGGVFNFRGSMTLVNCLFADNVAAGTGGAMFSDTFSGSINLTFTTCRFYHNSAGRAGAIANASSTGSCSVSIEECLFLANRATAEGGAVDNNTGSNAISSAVTRTSFVSNSAVSGGAIYNDGGGDVSRPTFTDCAFVNNQATNGGAIYNQGGDSRSTLTNCSFLGNAATSGGAMYNNGSRGVSPLTNCVLFGNGPSTTFATVNVSDPTSISLIYSMFEPTSLISQVNSSGPGNLTTIASPFISTTSVALANCSPAINAGLNSLNSATVDLVGNPRVVEGRIDMGAVEFQGATTLAVGVTANPSLTITQGQTAILTASGALSYSWSTGLSTTAISVSVAGPYTVTGVTGSCSGTATVTVTVTAAPPSITAQPVPASLVCAGASVVVTVGVSGTISRYQWLRGGSPVMGQTTATLSLSNVQVGDAGVYSLSLTGPAGSTTSSGFTLTVGNFAPIVFITLPNGSTVNVAGNLPTLILPTGNSVLQASGGTAYERTIILDRINGYEVRQVDSNTTGIFTINRLGLFTLTVTGAGGCSKTVQGVVEKY